HPERRQAGPLRAQRGAGRAVVDKDQLRGPRAGGGGQGVEEGVEGWPADGRNDDAGLLKSLEHARLLPCPDGQETLRARSFRTLAVRYRGPRSGPGRAAADTRASASVTIAASSPSRGSRREA